jgi:hypothetical protein
MTKLMHRECNQDDDDNGQQRADQLIHRRLR